MNRATPKHKHSKISTSFTKMNTTETEMYIPKTGRHIFGPLYMTYGLWELSTNELIFKSFGTTKNRTWRNCVSLFHAHYFAT